MNVYVGGTKDYSAMQGPCPSGYHVPLRSEWEAVDNAGIALGAWSSSNGTGLKTYLKMPYCGDRNRTTSNIEGQGSWGNYWASLADSSDTRLANCFAFDSTYTVVGGKYRTTGLCIRAFRNNPIVPDSSWTVLKQGTGTAGIYYNSTLGLISISSDGTTWYTLADKNLGATTVYNDGNTLSEANCGKYYQFGNNYGFAFTGSVTTSSSQVNAQNYGPGNYYSSSTFIIYSTGAWDSSGNNNLRGGVTGIVSPAELKNAYIGEVYEYSYDFRGKTLSQIQADGWTYGGISTPTINSGGISIPQDSNSSWSKLYCSPSGLTSKLSTAKKITLEIISNIGAVSTTTSNDCVLYLAGPSSYTSNGTGFGGGFTDDGFQRFTKVLGTDLYRGTYSTPSGEYTQTVIIDLTNKTMRNIVSNILDQTNTITDAQISTIRTLKYLRLGAEYNRYVKTVSITIV